MLRAIRRISSCSVSPIPVLSGGRRSGRSESDAGSSVGTSSHPERCRVRHARGSGRGKVQRSGEIRTAASRAGWCWTKAASCCAGSWTPTATTKSTCGATTRAASRSIGTSTPISTARQISIAGWARPASAGGSTPTKTARSSVGRRSRRRRSRPRSSPRWPPATPSRFQCVLPTAQELTALGLGEVQARDIAKKVAEAASGFAGRRRRPVGGRAASPSGSTSARIVLASSRRAGKARRAT